MRRLHAQKSIEGELLFAASADEPKAVAHQKREHDDHEHREGAHEIAQRLGTHHRPLRRVQHHGVQVIPRCREGIQQAGREGQGGKEHRVVLEASAHVAQREFEIHG